MPPSTSSISFATDIRPKFRDRDIKSMAGHFDLSSYDDVREHADSILERLAAGEMPCDGAWPAADVDTFRQWVTNGMQP